MNAVTGNKIALVEEKGKVNMCKGLADWKKKIEANNTVAVRRDAIHNIMFSLDLSLEQAMDALMIPDEERDTYRDKEQ